MFVDDDVHDISVDLKNCLATVGHYRKVGDE